MPTSTLYDIRIEAPNVVHCKFLRDFLFTPEIAQEIYQECNNIMDGKYHILWEMKTNIKPAKGVMNFFASEERTKRVISEAFCLDSHTLKLAANFYFKVKKPAVLGKAFDREKDAVEWISRN